VIPLAVIFSAVCLAIAVGARNYKEGQSLLTPVSFAVFLPAMVSLVPGIEVSPTLALIPITNVSLLIREFMAGNYLWTETLLAFGSTSLLAVASLWWATSQFEQESVLFRHAEDIRWSPFQRRRGPGQSAAPSPAAAFVLIVFELLALAWIGSSAANWSLQRTILVSQAIVIALPLFVLRRGGYDRKAVLALSTPRPAAWSATIVLILGGWLLSIGLASVQNRITPFPSDVLKRFQDLFDELSRMPVYTSLLLVAVVPAVCEETLCRGFLLHSLRPRLGRNGAVILTAVIFGLLHMDPYRLVPTIFLGLLFGWLVVQTGSIYPAMLAHAMNNALSFLVYKYEPWFEQVSWLQAESTLLPWYVAVPALTGLTFGIVWLKRIGGSRAPSDSRFPDRPSGAGG
jgi:sodium transport system permease protein